MGERSGKGRQADRRSLVGTRPPGGLADLVELVGGEGDRSRRFLGGLAAGALVGAAMAGAALLRWRSGSRGDEN